MTLHPAALWHVLWAPIQINLRYKVENSHWTRCGFWALRGVRPSCAAAASSYWTCHTVRTPMNHVHTCPHQPSAFVFALLGTGSRVKASSIQHQSKSPLLCCSLAPFKWISLAVGHKSNELLFPTSLPSLQPQIVPLMKYWFNVHIALFIASQTSPEVLYSGSGSSFSLWKSSFWRGPNWFFWSQSSVSCKRSDSWSLFSLT